MAALQAFPSITGPEFVEACKALESRSLDRLDGTDWLSVAWSGEELVIKQRRRIKTAGGDYGQEQSRESHGGERNANDDETVEDSDLEDVCDETLDLNADSFDSLTVDFSITLSPTYAVPILWFSCQPTSKGNPLGLDQVYSWLVPPAFHPSLQSVGVMGGISMAHHPISDRPAFFIHPCNTHDALSVLRPDDALSPEGYLILWLGLVGSSIGLHIPSKLLEVDGV